MPDNETLYFMRFYPNLNELYGGLLHGPVSYVLVWLCSYTIAIELEKRRIMRDIHLYYIYIFNI